MVGVAKSDGLNDNSFAPSTQKDSLEQEGIVKTVSLDVR